MKGQIEALETLAGCPGKPPDLYDFDRSCIALHPVTNLFKALQRHLDVEHGRRFCPTCLQGLPQSVCWRGRGGL